MSQWLLDQSCAQKRRETAHLCHRHPSGLPEECWLTRNGGRCLHLLQHPPAENQKLYRKNKKYFQEILNPGDGQIGVAWEYPDTSVRDFNLILTFQNINSYLLEHRTDTVKLGTRGSINHVSNSKKILPQWGTERKSCLWPAAGEERGVLEDPGQDYCPSSGHGVWQGKFYLESFESDPQPEYHKFLLSLYLVKLGWFSQAWEF